MKVLRLAALLFACMVAGAIGPSLQQAAYSRWDAFQEPGRFAHRVDEAMATTYACGNSNCGGINGPAVGLCSPDTDSGAGTCTDATGTLIGTPTTNAEAHTWSGAQTFSAATPAVTLSGTAPQSVCSPTACEYDFGTAVPGANPDVLFKDIGTGTNGNIDFKFQGASGSIATLSAGGSLSLSNGITAAGLITTNTANITDTAAGGIIKAGVNAGNAGYLEASPSINSTVVTTYALPLYTSATGTTAVNTAHCVQASAGSVAASGTAVITLSNNAVFASGSSFTVGLSITDNTGTLAQVLAPTTRNQSSGSTFTIDNNDVVNAHTIVYLACGT